MTSSERIATTVQVPTRLRPMSISDIEAAVEVEREGYAFPWPRAAFVDCLGAGYECWVGAVGDSVIGHGILSVAADEAMLLNVCVARRTRGMGHGRALTRHLIGRARVAGATKVFLEVRLSNRAAMTLYADLGFREIGRRRNYYRSQWGREDALVMALDLCLVPG